MASRSSFENQFSDYHADISSNILNESKDGVSNLFYKKLQCFKEAKLELVTTKMEKDIFYDGTVYTGSAGWALFYLVNGLAKKDRHDMFQTALQYINLEHLKGRRISFLCGDAGPLSIATVLSYKLLTNSDKILPDYKTLSSRLMELITILEDSPDELLYGKSGYLYALLFVNRHVGGKDIIPANHIEKVVASIIQSGKQLSREMKSESPLLWQWHGKIYLGAAHGMAGILYMLLQARAYVKGNELRSFIKPTLDWLLNQRFSSGNFPSSLNSSSGDRLVQWCHGAPGFVSLCCLAYQVFEEEKYLKTAISCGDIIWQRGLSTKGYSICHGVSGNAYPFLELYQTTKTMHGHYACMMEYSLCLHSRGRDSCSVVDFKWALAKSIVIQKPVHLYRACCFMEWCALERRGSELHRPDRPASLFEGVLGRIYLAEEIIRPLTARFPAYSL